MPDQARAESSPCKIILRCVLYDGNLSVYSCDLIQYTNGDVSCKDHIIYTICDTLVHWREVFQWQRATQLAWAGSLAARGKITIIGIPNRLNYCIIFIMHT